MAEISLLQLIAYGVMGAFLLIAAWRVAAALDLAGELAGDREAVRDYLRILEEPRARRRAAMLRRLQRRLARRADGPVARLLADLEQHGPAALAASRARFADAVLLRVEPVRHGLAQLMRVAAPLGLGFTTLVLAVSLTTLDPAAGEGPARLLAALPLSLMTTVLAMFAVVPMRLAEGRLRHVAEDLVATSEALFESLAPPPEPRGDGGSR